MQERICVLLRDGLFRRHVAAKVGVDEATFSRWFHQGINLGKGRLYKFALEVQRAEAEYAESCVTNLKANGATNPKTVQWLLSRRFPELYGRKDNVEEVSPEDKNAQAQAVRTLLIERLERLFPEVPEPPKEETAAPVAGASNAV